MEEFLDNESEIGNVEETLAIEIMDGRKTLNTKNQYRLKIQNFQKWVLIKHPNCLNEEGTLNLPLLDVTMRSGQPWGNATSFTAPDGRQRERVRVRERERMRERERV